MFHGRTLTAMASRIGRTSKRTDARVAALCRLLAGGATRRAASAGAGINSDTFYDWLERDPTFSDAVQKAEADAELMFTSIVAAAASDSWQAAAWWLERRRPDDYGRRDRVELDIRQQALQVAQAYGLDPNEVLREAEQWLTR